MKVVQKTGLWSSYYLWHIVGCVIITFYLNYVYFFDNLVPVGFIAGGFIIIISYFWGVNNLIHAWNKLHDKAFIHQLFVCSLISRVFSVIFLYFFFEWQTGQPFEYNAVDSHFYHETAVKIASHFSNADFRISNYTAGIKFSDLGFNIYLGIIYTIFGPSLIISRIIGAILSAFTVVYIYKITKNIDANSLSAKIAGISAMILPNFLIYLGTQLKETVMIFMVVAVLLLIIKILKYEQRTLINFTLLLSLLFALFTFRTVLASVTLSSCVLYGFFGHPFRNRITNIVVTFIILTAFIFILINSEIGTEITENVVKASTSQTENLQFRAERDYGNKFALLAGAPLFFSIVFIAPFPSYISVPFQEYIWLFIGGNFIRNIYAFFTIAGIFYCIRHNFRNTSLLLFYAIGYLLVLAKSPFAISERFHLPAVPALLIFSAIGLTYYSPLLKKYFTWYLAFICLLIFLWNYIKLTGRV